MVESQEVYPASCNGTQIRLAKSVDRIKKPPQRTYNDLSNYIYIYN